MCRLEQLRTNEIYLVQKLKSLSDEEHWQDDQVCLPPDGPVLTTHSSQRRMQALEQSDLQRSKRAQRTILGVISRSAPSRYSCKPA